MRQWIRCLAPLTVVMLLAFVPATLIPSQAADAGPYHDSRATLFRTPAGAVPVSSNVTLRLRAPADNYDGVTVRTLDVNTNSQNYLPMTKVTTTPEGHDFWQVVVTTPPNPTLLNYRFVLRKGDTISYYEDDARDALGNYDWSKKGGAGTAVSDSSDQSWQITVYAPDFTTPQWMHDAVIYQIFPDRFRDGDTLNDPKDGSRVFYGNMPLTFHKTWNEMVTDFRNVPNTQPNSDFFGGDLKGIQDKLSYLKALGVTVLYLNPIFEADSNHRYDTVDYKKIDPILGTQADWEALVTAAKAQGINIILDGVFNHVSSDSPYFDRYHHFIGGACESLKSEYRFWFLFRKPTSQEPQKACIDDGNGNSYYTSWGGFDSIPKLNSTNPMVRGFLYNNPDSVARTWLKDGASGWRLDAANEIDDGSASNPYWEKFRQAVHEANPNAVIVGEIWDDASRWLTGTQFDSTMDYRLRRGVLGYTLERNFTDNDGTIPALKPSQFDGLLQAMFEDYPPQAMDAMMNLLGSHDTSRLYFLLGNNPQSQRLAAFMDYMLPGAPTIYYGDEISLNAPDVSIQDDPYNRAPYPWPDATGNHYAAPDLNMLAYYQRLAQVRATHPALRDGAFRTLLTDDNGGVYAFLRTDSSSGDAVLVVSNRATKDQPFTVDVQGYLPDGAAIVDQIGGGPLTVKGGKVSGTVLARRGAAYTVEGPSDSAAVIATLTATASDGKVELSWPPHDNLVTYNVYRSYFADGGFVKLNDTPIADTPPYTDTTVSNGTQYSYYLEALSSRGLLMGQTKVVTAGPGTPISSAKITQTAITAPLSVDGVTFRSNVVFDATNKQHVVAQAALIAPGAGSKDITGWQPMTLPENAPSQQNSWIATIRASQAGSYEAVARFSTNGGIAWTYTDPIAVTVTAPESITPPAAPGNLKVAQSAPFNVTLTWAAVPGAYGYHVYKGSGKDSALLSETEQPTFRDVTAVEGQSLTYTITAFDKSLNESAPTPITVQVNVQAVKVTFRATVPATTPPTSPVYLAGDFGTKDYPSWDPGGLKMSDKGNNVWEITLNLSAGTVVQYKYVRGTWDSVEKDAQCAEIPNRSFTVKAAQDGALVEADQVAKWHDVDKCP